jgi:uncharacterized protein
MNQLKNTDAATIHVRDWKFGSDEDIPKFWHGGRKSITRFYDNLSIFFPAGERFFIQAVRAYAPKVSDPKLREEVELFCKQEAMHNREHIRYNNHLMTQTPLFKKFEDRVQFVLKRAQQKTPRIHQLAVTAALEHFTALLGHFVLNDPRLLEGAHPEMAALWRWHAAEETEHKAVAFDVFRAVNGSERVRRFAMVTAASMFWFFVLEQQVRLMREEGILFDMKEWGALFGHLFVKPGGMFPLFKMAADYFRRDFHPWELDNSPLIKDYQRPAEYGATA